MKNWSVNLGTVADTVVVAAWGGDPLDIAAAADGVVAVDGLKDVVRDVDELEEGVAGPTTACPTGAAW